MNGTTTTTAMFRAAILDPAKRAHYRLALLSLLITNALQFSIS